MRLGGIEAGGTKFICAIGDEKGNIEKRVSFPTTNVEETMKGVFDFFDNENIDALGIGSFGPVDLHKGSKTYGYITNTPKVGWDNFDFVGTIQERYPNLKICFDTDVNAAALAELEFGCDDSINNLIYITIGTGVGGGIIINRQLVHGLTHPELGHMRLVKREDDNYEGFCKCHGNCFEGLACGPAVEKRYNKKGQDLASDDPAWDLEAYYIGQALANLIVTISPEKIVLGGGVMHQENLLKLVKKYVKEFLNDYVQSEYLTTDKIDEYIVTPSLEDNAGVTGCLLLAKSVCE